MGFDVLSLQGAWVTSGKVVSALVVNVQNHLMIDVTFPQAMGDVVYDPFNYLISDPGKGTLSDHPDYVTLVSGNTYRLRWLSGTMFYGLTVTISTSGMFDPLDNPVPDYSGSDIASWFVFFFSSVTNVLSLSTNTIQVYFALSMLSSDAMTASYYIISGPGKGTLNSSPDYIEEISSNQYLLVWNSGEMLNGGSITISVNPSMRDNGGVLIDDPKYGTSTGIGESPTIQEVKAQRSIISVSGLNIDVTFSEQIGSGSTNSINYYLSGTGKGTILTHPDNVSLLSGNTYRLRWSSGKAINKDFTITVQNVYDLAGNLIGTPNSETDYFSKEENLLIQFREVIAPELAETLNTDAIENYTAWKRLFYYWKYRRDTGGANDWFLDSEPELYFVDPPTEIIGESPPLYASANPPSYCFDSNISYVTLTSFGGTGETVVWYSDIDGINKIGTGETITIDAPSLTTTYYARWETRYRPSTDFTSVTITVSSSMVDPISATCDRDDICPGS